MNTPTRGRVWPFPLSPQQQKQAARNNKRQQREAIVNGKEALL